MECAFVKKEYLAFLKNYRNFGKLTEEEIDIVNNEPVLTFRCITCRFYKEGRREDIDEDIYLCTFKGQNKEIGPINEGHSLFGDETEEIIENLYENDSNHFDTSFENDEYYESHFDSHRQASWEEKMDKLVIKITEDNFQSLEEVLKVIDINSKQKKATSYP